MRVNTVLVAGFLVTFSAVTAQQQNYYENIPRQQVPSSSGTGNNGYYGSSTYQQRVINRRTPQQQPLWSNSDTTQQKPRRTHYGQTLSRFFDTPQGASYPVTTAPRRWSNGNRWNSAASTTQPRLPSRDTQGRVRMGVSNSFCDDAKSNLTADWDMSPVNHTCYHPQRRFPVDSSLPPLQHCDRLPPRYVPMHLCMNQRIPYEDDIPTHGDHRPLWPKFGEYIFVPRERWLHNIEHGAIVMLYHPCAHPAEVAKLKRLVKDCVGKHVITPSTLLPPDRPLALVAWSCRLLMSSVDEDIVKAFIQQRAHKGPEGTYTKEGQYTFGLLQQATMSGNGALFGYSRVQCVNRPST